MEYNMNIDKTNFQSCFESFWNNPEDLMLSHTNPEIIKNYFGEVNWNQEENRQAFIKNLKKVDMINARGILIGFANVLAEYAPLYDEKFVMELIRGIDWSETTIVDPPIIQIIANQLRPDIISWNFDEITELLGPGLFWITIVYSGRLSNFKIFYREQMEQLYKKAKHDKVYGDVIEW